ncbi:MAG: hypothetical protein H6993_16670 [Pseudomonadales bacterium]|nr:hypothetical protein [Pseudomonadales bacterium]MCP5185601.1 hypothetical protein [Pseudomonadales bacterium]
MSKPTFLPLLNSIAVNEAKGERLLGTWAKSTRDPQLKSVLEFVAIREGEHAMAFTKRMCELGYSVDEASAYQVFRNFDDLLACAGSTATDAEKVAMLAGDSRGETKDPFRGFFNDTTIDPQTGALLGRYIAEERDSGRRLRAEYDRVRASASTPAGDEVSELRACVAAMQVELESLRRQVNGGR